MVQYMGNTLLAEAELRNLVDAMERDPKDGPTQKVCVKSGEQPELSRAVPGVWDQH
jgi:hypothetical protein